MPDHRLYTDLAIWWPLFSAPAEYDEEAAWIIAALENEMGRFPASMLELGSGGGVSVGGGKSGLIGATTAGLAGGGVEVAA